MLERKPSLTFAMPVLNGEKYIQRALTSIQNQTQVDIEIIVSDNDSTDSTLDIARTFAVGDPRIRVQTGSRVSAKENFSRVLGSARGQLVCWAAHDDYWDPKFASTAQENLAHGGNYFIPNWWVGKIGTSRGLAPTANILTFLQSPDSVERTFKFVNLHHMSHKCNLVYGVFKRDFLQERFHEQDISDDGAFGANVAHKSEGVISDQVLFWKDFRGDDSYFQFKRLISRMVSAARSQGLTRDFNLAKQASLENLCRLCPDWCTDFKLVYNQYELFPKGQNIFTEEAISALIDEVHARQT